MEKSLAQAYSKMERKYGGSAFTREDAVDELGTSLNYTDQIIHRLREKAAMQRVGWGKYRLVDPRKWIGIAGTAEALPQMEGVLSKMLSLVPVQKIHSLILYGSVARGESTKESDIDLILITDRRGRARMEKALEDLPEKVNVLVLSREGVSGLSEEDPLFLLFSESEGDVLFDVDNDYKEAVSEAVWNLAGKPRKKYLGKYLKLAEGFLDTSRKLSEKGKKPQLATYFLVFSARTLLMLEQVLLDRADPYEVSSGLRKILGSNYAKLYSAYRREREEKHEKGAKIKPVKDTLSKVEKLREKIEQEVNQIEEEEEAPEGREKP